MRGVLGFLIACLALGSAHANPLRMHGTPVGSGPIPDLIVHVLPTQTAVLDLTSVTTHCNGTELMNVTPVGTGASFEVDRGQVLIASTTETWRKSELVANTGYSADSDHQALNLIHTDGAAVGTGAATLNILCTSSGLTKVVRVDVVAGPSFDWNYGVETPVRYGGLNMLTFGSPVSRYSVDAGAGSCGAVPCSTRFEIWENHLMILCAPGASGTCPASGANTGVYASGTAADVFTPSAGTSEDVLIDDSMGTPFSVHFHYIAHQRDIAIAPTGSSWTTKDKAQSCQMTTQAVHYGDTIMHEGTRALRAVYGPFTGANACILGFPRVGSKTQYTTPTTGPLPEFAVSGITCPGANSPNCYSRPYSPSFVTWTCREYFECDYGMVQNVELWGGPTNERWTGFNTKNVSATQGIVVYAANGWKAIDFQVDHNKADAISTGIGSDAGSYAYYKDNFVSDGSAQGSFAYCNSIVDGNRVLRHFSSDVFHMGMQSCNDGSEGDAYSSFSWNWINGLNAGPGHPDFAQGDWSAGLKLSLGNNHVYKAVGNLMSGAPFHIITCQDVDSTVVVPNTFSPAGCSGNSNFIDPATAGNCANKVCANGTYRSSDGQPFLMHDGIPIGATVQYSNYGNYANSVFALGMQLNAAGPGSVVSYNAFFYSNNLADPAKSNLIGGGYAPPLIANGNAGAIFSADGNIVTANAFSWVDTSTFPAPGIDTPLVSNVDNTNGCATASTCFPNLALSPWLVNYADRMQPNIDTYVLGGAAAGHGPAQVVDIRGRKVTNPSAVAPHAGIPLTLPYCSSAPVIQHTGTGQSVGDVFSIVAPVTWTQTTGTKQSVWQLQWISGNAFQGANVSGPSPTTNTTYALQAADLAHAHDPGTHINIFYEEYTGLTSAGSNTCATAQFAID